MRSLTHTSAGASNPTPFISSLSSHISSNTTSLSRLPPDTQANTPILHRHPGIPDTGLTSGSLHAGHHSFFNISNDLSPLPTHVKNNVSNAIQNGWARVTMRRYSGAIQQFLDFCILHRVPDNLRFPADEFVLCAFAASSVGKHSGNTARARLSALKAWHIAHNMEWKGSTRLRHVLNGVRNLAPGHSRRPPRPPINAKMLSQLVENLDLTSPLDAAVAACATTAFWGQCRLGELLPSSVAASLSTSLPTRADFKRSLRNSQSCILHLPKTKTHHQGHDVVLVDQRAPIDPIVSLKVHLRVNGVPRDKPIFSYLSPDGIQTLTKTLFLHRCNAIWHLLGYPHTTGHSFRIGGTTELLIAGTPPDVVKAMGRWSSESFLRYWRSLDDLAPRHVRNLHSSCSVRRSIRRRSTTSGG
jgi:hypothetical protein